jgi:hypothetical protein
MTFKESWQQVPQQFKIFLYVVLGIIGAFFFGLLFGWVIVWLWNWLMPMIFGLPTITFWQGVGLFVLAKILFGGFSSHGDSGKSSKKGGFKSEWKKEWDKEWSKEWNEHKGCGKGFDSWKHYDEWWEHEGKSAFEKFSTQADENGEPEPEPEKPEA